MVGCPMNMEGNHHRDGYGRADSPRRMARQIDLNTSIINLNMQHRGRELYCAVKLSGFCVLLTRAVYDAVGGLDERFWLGFFDDDNLAERRAGLGYRCYNVLLPIGKMSGQP